MTKLQISLTDQEASLLSQRAASLGYDVTKYAKFILAREAEDALRDIPNFKASPNMEELVAQAVEDDKNGKSRKWPLGKYDN